MESRFRLILGVIGVVCSPMVRGVDFKIPATEGFDAAIKAVTEFRRKNPNYNQPVFVTFAPGVRYLDRCVLLGREISGTEDSPTVFKAGRGGDVVFSGGKVITGWEIGKQGVWRVQCGLDEFLDERGEPLRQDSAFNKKNRYLYYDDPEDWPPENETLDRVPLSTNDYPMTQLFANDQRRFRPRYPTSGYFRMKGSPQENGKKSDCSFLWDEKDGLRTQFRNQEDVDVCAFLLINLNRNPLVCVQAGDRPEDRVVVLRGHTGGGWSGEFENGFPYFFDNVAEEFRNPGQWYWDRKTSRLAYWPKPGETPSNTRIVVPRLSRLLVLRGARHVRFEGLQFAHAAFRRPHDGFLNPQGELHSYAAVYVWGGQFNVFRDCCFRNLGSYAVTLTGSATDNLIEGCEFFDIGAGCVKVIGSRNTIRDCDLGYFGQFQPGGTGIMAYTVNNLRIEHCNIHDAYYMGINIGYAFGYHHPTEAHDNYVGHCHIWHLGDNLVADQGGIYINGVNDGTVVECNLIHDITARLYGGWGLYTDEGASGVRMTGNVVYNTRDAAFHQNFGRENLIANNIFVDCGAREGIVSVSKRNHPDSFVFQNNVIVWSGQQPIYKAASDWNPEFFSIGENYFHKCDGEVNFAEGWRDGRGFDRSSVTGADPKFVNPQRGDYRLKSDSPVFSAIKFSPVLQVRPGRIGKNVFLPRFQPICQAFSDPEAR